MHRFLVHPIRAHDTYVALVAQPCADALPVNCLQRAQEAVCAAATDDWWRAAREPDRRAVGIRPWPCVAMPLFHHRYWDTDYAATELFLTARDDLPAHLRICGMSRPQQSRSSAPVSPLGILWARRMAHEHAFSEEAIDRWQSFVSGCNVAMIHQRLLVAGGMPELNDEVHIGPRLTMLVLAAQVGMLVCHVR